MEDILKHCGVASFLLEMKLLICAVALFGFNLGSSDVVVGGIILLFSCIHETLEFKFLKGAIGFCQGFKRRWNNSSSNVDVDVVRGLVVFTEQVGGSSNDRRDGRRIVLKTRVVDHIEKVATSDLCLIHLCGQHAQFLQCSPVWHQVTYLPRRKPRHRYKDVIQRGMCNFDTYAFIARAAVEGQFNELRVSWKNGLGGKESSELLGEQSEAIRMTKGCVAKKTQRRILNLNDVAWGSISCIDEGSHW